MINFIQINLNHAIAPTTDVGNVQNCVYLLQEQHFFSIRNKKNLYAAKCSFEYGQTRAGIYISAPHTFTFLPLHRFTGRDISSGLLESKELTQPMIIASVYMDSLIPQVPDLLLDLIDYCKKEQLPLLFGADTNSWSSFWSSQEENKRGKMIEQLVITECLEIYNIGNSPTFRRPLGPHGNIVEKIIDVTFGMNIKDKVQNWRFAKSMLSDHLPIMFQIGRGSNTKTTAWNYKRADWELFQNKAGAYNTLDASGPWTQCRIERELTSFYTDLNNIMTLTIPKVDSRAGGL
jgi:hypothetical protein